MASDSTNGISPPSSLWMQLASLSFTVSGVQSDLLVIRFFLFLAYIMLLLNALLVSNGIPLDSILWVALNLYLHGASFLHLLWDERQVKMSSEEEALWRMFFRTGGLSRRLFYSIVLPGMDLVDFNSDESIPTSDMFYIIYSGRVRLRVYDQANELQVERMLGSGEMFDITYMGMFAEDCIFTQKTALTCTAMSNVKAFRFTREAMKHIAHHRFSKDIWQSLLINNLSLIVESSRRERDRNASNDDPYSDPIFRPLEKWEEPHAHAAGSGRALRRPLRHLLRSIRISFSPPWPCGGHPTGIRQLLLSAPPSSVETNESPQFHSTITL